MPRAKGGSIPPPRVMIHPGQGGPISDLNEHDVLSGRGGRINNHPGNITFRTVVEDYKREYLDPRTRKLEKAHVAARLVSQIRSTNPPGRFLREDPVNPGCYVEIGDTKAWKKAGQALREDAPDVRKEIDEDIEITVKQIPEKPQSDPNYASPLQQQQQPAYHQQHQYRPGVPPGIPPSVSYSPTSAPMPLAPPSSGVGGPRPDPPEAVGVTGYRQPPLRYFSGRGGRGGVASSGRGFPDRRGRGPPPPPSLHHPQQQHQQQFPVLQPQQGYHHHQNYYNHPPQPAMVMAPPHSQHYPTPGPQFQQHPPPPFQQPPYQHHHPQQYPPHGHPNQQPPGYNNGPPPPQPHPQFTAPPQDNGKKHSKKKSSSPIPPLIAPAAIAVAHGIHQTMDVVTGLTNRVTKRRTAVSSSRGSAESEFPPHMSIATDFTMSDVSAMGESRNGFSGVFDESTSIPPPAAQKLQQQQGATGPAPGTGGGTTAHLKQSTGTTSSSSKSRDNSLTMSDLMGSGFSLGMSGRTRSFPDLMLSTNDLLPPLQSDFGDSDREEKEQRRAPFHRQSSSESSEMGAFHPIRGRNNTGNISGLNDAMSIMSLDSRKSTKSETSSWLENFRSMQSIHSDMNPWEAGGSGVSGGGMGMSLVRNQMNDGSDNGSVRSFLSDVSTELNALDLAEPLLPPIQTDSGLNDSGSDYMMARPDP